MEDMNTNINNKNMYNKFEFSELSSTTSSVKSGEVNLGRFKNISNTDITFGNFGEKKFFNTSDEKHHPKKLFCKNIIDGKECLFDKRCLFAHSYEEKYNDDCNFEDNCIHIFFSKNGHCLNANPKLKICFRKHPSENFETYHNRIGTDKKYPNVPKKTHIPDRKFTKMCRTITEQGVEPCIRSSCNFAHTDSELVILPCRFKERCNNIEFNDGLFKNKGEKICKFLHDNETKENYKFRLIL